jgi:two-component system, NtrC family, nitrogen regulation response regulator GlnG
VKVLEAYPWPGNVRELENTLQRAAVLATADVLLPKDIPLGQVPAEHPVRAQASAGSDSEEVTPDLAVETLFQMAEADPSLQLLPWLEREFTQRAMSRAGNNQVRAAKLLGITRATLRKRLERNDAAVADGVEE